MEFPRLIYRGEPDHLGSGQVGENKRVNSQDELDEHLEQGWRLTRHVEGAAADVDVAAADDPEAEDDPPAVGDAPAAAPVAKPAKAKKAAAKKK